MAHEAEMETKEREHVKVDCWCGHGTARHVDRSSGIISGRYEYQLACVECESIVTQ